MSQEQEPRPETEASIKARLTLELIAQIVKSSGLISLEQPTFQGPEHGVMTQIPTLTEAGVKSTAAGIRRPRRTREEINDALAKAYKLVHEQYPALPAPQVTRRARALVRANKIN